MLTHTHIHTYTLQYTSRSASAQNPGIAARQVHGLLHQELLLCVEGVVARAEEDK
jgi:hypothetical protein